MNTISRSSRSIPVYPESSDTDSGTYNRIWHYNSERIEQDLHVAPTNAEASFWKHRKEVREKLNRNSYTSLPKLDSAAYQALAQLVDNYSETIKETSAYKTRAQNELAQLRIVRAGTQTSPENKEFLAMIVGTGDAMNASELKRRQLLIAHSENATEEILAELAVSMFEDVREAVADHRACPASIHMMLTDDESADVRYALAENHNLSFTILEKLSHDENPYVAVRAERTMRRVLFNNVVCLEIPADDEESQATSVG